MSRKAASDTRTPNELRGANPLCDEGGRRKLRVFHGCQHLLEQKSTLRTLQTHFRFCRSYSLSVADPLRGPRCIASYVSDCVQLQSILRSTLTFLVRCGTSAPECHGRRRTSLQPIGQIARQREKKRSKTKEGRGTEKQNGLTFIHRSFGVSGVRK